MGRIPANYVAEVGLFVVILGHLDRDSMKTRACSLFTREIRRTLLQEFRGVWVLGGVRERLSRYKWFHGWKRTNRESRKRECGPQLWRSFFSLSLGIVFGWRVEKEGSFRQVLVVPAVSERVQHMRYWGLTIFSVGESVFCILLLIFVRYFYAVTFRRWITQRRRSSQAVYEEVPIDVMPDVDRVIVDLENMQPFGEREDTVSD